ncbi:MAG: hypothetical protein QOJ56_1575 [Mycobacterium sp.]|nr:hypothetical protein [Mycobacterium sp.]
MGWRVIATGVRRGVKKVRKSLTALAAALGVPCMILASAGVIAAPRAAAQPSQCPNPNMTTAFVDYSYSSHGGGVWVTCVPYTNVGHNCYAPAGGANGPKLYPAGQGPAPECRSIYNSR